MDDKDRITLEHYKRVAASCGHAPTSTMKEQTIRRAEIDFFISEIDPLAEKKPDLVILDIGCGNGYLLSILRERFESAELHGIDITPEFHDLSVGRNLDVNFINGDCRIPNFFDKKVDIVISERSIINIIEESERIQTFKNIASLMHKDSIYLMAESFQEPLANLNKARKENFFEPLSIPEKNHYLLEEELEILKTLGLKERKTKMGKNYLSTFFFISRIIHLLLKPEGAKKEGTEIVRFLVEGLQPGIGNYSPILFRKFSY